MPKSFFKRSKKDAIAKPNKNQVQTEMTSGVTQNVDPYSGPTAPDYNQTLREVSRFFLAIAGVFLWMDAPNIAIYCTIASIVLLHCGTSFSIKNWILRAIAWSSLVTCCIACLLQNALRFVDKERTYIIHEVTRLSLYGIDTCWSVLLFIVFGLSFLSKFSVVEKRTKINFLKMNYERNQTYTLDKIIN